MHENNWLFSTIYVLLYVILGVFSFLFFVLKDLEGKVEYWMAHYEEDLEVKTSEVQDLEIAVLRGSYTFDISYAEKFVFTWDKLYWNLVLDTEASSSSNTNLVAV